MILFNKQVVWTPVLVRDSLAVALERNFAEACLGHKPKDMRQLVVAVSARIKSESKRGLVSNLLDMYEGSLLPKGIYAGSNGVWLTLDVSAISNSVRPFTYHGHNEELVADRFWLMRAFQAWADCATTLLDWK